MSVFGLEAYGLTNIALTLGVNQNIQKGLVRHVTFDAVGISGPGWLDGWAGRVGITVPSSSATSTLSNFPVYVDLSDLPSQFFENVSSDGADIRVTTSDGETELPFELVDITTSGAPSCASNCTGELHFKASSISSFTDTIFYVYYDNPTAIAYTPSGTYGSESVWVDYYAVFHLNEAVNTTANGYANSAGGGDGTGVSMAQSAIAGALGGGFAQDFTGGDHITFTEALSSEDTVTMSAWIYPDTSQANYAGILESRDDGLQGLLESGGGANELTAAWDGTESDFNSNLNWSQGSWQYIAAVVTPDSTVLYLNTATATQGSNDPSSPSDWYIGTDPSHIGARDWEGYLDEIRIAKNALSDDWVAAEYHNQSSPGTFYTVSDAVTNSTPASQAVPGRLGQAARFDGADDEILLGDLNATIKTIAFWIKTSDTTTQEVLDLDGTDHIEINASSQIAPASFPGTTNTFIDGQPGSSITSDWHHVVITDTAGIDASAVVLGKVGSTFFDGILDDVRFYGHVLSANTIQRLYEMGATTKISTNILTNPELDNGLISHWTFDAADGVDLAQSASIRDRIGGNHATPYNMKADWYRDWSYRLPVAIQSSQVSSTLSSFPVYVDLSDMPAAFFTNVASDGADIRMTTADGKSEVAVEIVSINTASSTGELHFNAPTLSDSVDTSFYLYYGQAGATAPAATSTYGSQAVWSNGYVAVWHLEEGASGTGNSNIYLDSTANEFHCDDFVSSTSKPSKLGLAQDFDGTDDYIRCLGTDTASEFSFSGDFSASTWFRPHTGTTNSRIFDNRGRGGGGPGGPEGFYLKIRSQSGTEWGFHDTDIEDTDGDLMAIQQNDGQDYLYEQWHHTHMTWDNSAQEWVQYVNAGVDAIVTTLTNSEDGSIDVVDSDIDFSIGAGIAAGGAMSLPPAQAIDGEIDEVRVLSRKLSSGWVETEYNNQNNPTTFYSVGSQETPGEDSPMTFLRPGRLSQALGFTTLKSLLRDELRPYLRLGNDNSLNITFPLTVAAWIKPNTATTYNAGTIIGKGSEFDDGFRWALSLGTNYGPYFTKVNSDGVTSETASMSSLLTSEEWSHVVFTVESDGGWTYYLDGVEDSAGSFSSLTFNATTDDAYMGTYYTPGNGSNGAPLGAYLDDVRLYGRTLSANEVMRLYGLGGTTKFGVTPKESSSSLETSLVAHYTFDGVTGIDSGQTLEVRDEAGSHHADMSSISTSDVAPGALGQALVFDGLDDTLLVSHDAALSFGSGDSMTLGALVRPDIVSSTYAIAAKADFTNSNLDMNYSLRIDGGKLMFTYRATSGDFVSYRSESAVVSANEWQHVGVTYTFGTGSSIALYVDGVEVAGSWLDSATGNDAPTQPSVGLQIGSRNTGEYYEGRLDDVRLYSRALSTEEMYRLHALGG